MRMERRGNKNDILADDDDDDDDNMMMIMKMHGRWAVLLCAMMTVSR